MMFRPEQHETSTRAADFRAGQQQVHVVWLRMLATLLEAVRKGFETHLFTSLATIDTFLHSGIYVMSHGFFQIICLTPRNSKLRWNGLAHAYAGHATDRIVERFKVLDVHRGHHADPGVEDLQGVLISLLVAAARGVRVRELVDQTEGRPARENRVEIHFFHTLSTRSN
jgi:phosphatidylserine/phosphatidylglycerophosphate/cardiolipin synthase-like enzyme